MLPGLLDPDCTDCPRLVATRLSAQADAPARYRGQTYWGRPVPGHGDPQAWLLILGLAPAPHGGNRTGRAFQGDASGGFLFAALQAAGLANESNALSGVWISNIVRCSPPDHRPTPQEFHNCRRFLLAELAALTNLRGVLCLGSQSWLHTQRAIDPDTKSVPFTHQAQRQINQVSLVASYHPSPRNVNTGKLSQADLLACLDILITSQSK